VTLPSSTRARVHTGAAQNFVGGWLSHYGSELGRDGAPGLAQARERDVSRAALVNMVDLSERVSSADGTNLIASLGEQERVQLIESFGRYTSDLMSAAATPPISCRHLLAIRT
jgi:hypothetical protein